MSCCSLPIDMPFYVCTRSFAEIRATIPHPQGSRRLSETSRRSRRELPPLPGFCHGAVDGVDLGHIFDPSPDVDGIAVRLWAATAFRSPSLPSTRVRNPPEASLNAMPNFIRGTVLTNALKWRLPMMILAPSGISRRTECSCIVLFYGSEQRARAGIPACGVASGPWHRETPFADWDRRWRLPSRGGSCY